jgi:hypothetical protein
VAETNKTAVPEFSPFELVVQAVVADGEVGPELAAIPITPTFLRDVKARQALLGTCGANSLRYTDGRVGDGIWLEELPDPATFVGEADPAAAYAAAAREHMSDMPAVNPRGTEVEVDDVGFSVHAYPKHEGAAFCSIQVSMDALMAMVATQEASIELHGGQGAWDGSRTRLGYARGPWGDPAGLLDEHERLVTSRDAYDAVFAPAKAPSRAPGL